jgi:hypothetical protein
VIAWGWVLGSIVTGLDASIMGLLLAWQSSFFKKKDIIGGQEKFFMKWALWLHMWALIRQDEHIFFLKFVLICEASHSYRSRWSNFGQNWIENISTN